MKPMLADAGTLPDPEEGWAFEFKWDGVRAIVTVDAEGTVRLSSRLGRDVTASYPELHGLGAALAGRSAVLDGEIVALGPGGRPDFGALQKRIHVTDPGRVRQLAGEVPVSLFLFDLLSLDGTDTSTLPYAERRDRLEALGLAGPGWATPPSYRSGGAAVLKVARSQGLEGVVAKRLDRPYRPGRRSGDWRKVKLTRTQEVVLAGWTPGRGSRQGFRALVLGIPGPGGLAYVGKVGSGFTDDMLDELSARLRPLRRVDSPLLDLPARAELAGVTWVEPELVGEVSFSEWTADGHLRHPTWRGLRPDKLPGQVGREDR